MNVHIGPDLIIQRWSYDLGKTLGRVVDKLAPDVEICKTLEDRIRPKGVKVYGETCIPAGTYDYAVTWSNKFKRPLIEIYPVEGFTGIRIHRGDSANDTKGCPLVGRKFNGHDLDDAKQAEEFLMDYIGYIPGMVEAKETVRGSIQIIDDVNLVAAFLKSQGDIA